MLLYIYFFLNKQFSILTFLTTEMWLLNYNNYNITANITLR